MIGHPDYRIGNRLLYKDRINGDEWEFYIEGVSHNFSYTEGFTTTLDVTRGLKLNGSQRVDRFNPPAGPPERFKGGLLGEPSQEELLALQEATNGSKDSTAPGLGNTGNTSEIVRPAEGYVTSPYGMRFHPVDKVNKMHNGVDIAGGGTTIKAMASGVVITARNHSTLGRYIEIDHGNLNGKGKVTTLYAHLKSIHVAVGQKVTAGQQIGVMGTTGKSTGVHLHFEVWVDGKRVDPETWVTW